MELKLGRGLTWNEEDKAMIASILGTRAFDYLISSPFTAETSLVSIENNENIQNKLSDLVERPNSSNFSWNYGFFLANFEVEIRRFGFELGRWVL